ncbi:hypothetical protein GCM10010424_68450 [Streptomyces lienomycini]
MWRGRARIEMYMAAHAPDSPALMRPAATGTVLTPPGDTRVAPPSLRSTRPRNTACSRCRWPSELPVACHLAAPVPGEGAVRVVGQGLDRGAEGVEDGLGAMGCDGQVDQQVADHHHRVDGP